MLLASGAEFSFSVLQFDGVIHVAGNAAEGITVGGHAEAQPQIVSGIDNENDENDGDGNSFHRLVSLSPLIRGRNWAAILEPQPARLKKAVFDLQKFPQGLKRLSHNRTAAPPLDYFFNSSAGSRPRLTQISPLRR